MTNSQATERKQKALVIGGGIVGIQCGIHLLKEGFHVQILERGKPGQEASFGNAGCLAVSEVVPMAMPGLIKHVPGWLMDPLGPLAIRWSRFPALFPWLWQFMRSGTWAQVERSSEAASRLMKLTTDSWNDIAKEAGLHNEIHWTGNITVYETEAAYQSDQAYWDIYKKRGIPFTKLTPDQLREKEPDLAPIFKHAVYCPSYARVSDPARIAGRLSEYFQSLGGEVITGQALDFTYNQNKPIAVRCSDGREVFFDKVVVAAGAWSKTLAKKLGCKVLLESERGYNTTLPDPGVRLNHPIMSAEGHFALSHLDIGLRIGGAAEFAGLDAPANFKRSKALLTLGRRFLPALKEDGAKEWMGHRPSTPDSLAVVGPSPIHDNVFYAFGHGHLGLTQAAGTGQVIAELASGKTPSINIDAYRIDRFN